MNTNEKKDSNVMELNKKLNGLNQEMDQLIKNFSSLTEKENGSLKKLDEIFHEMREAIKKAENATQKYNSEKSEFSKISAEKNANLKRQKEILSELESVHAQMKNEIDKNAKIEIMIKADGMIESDAELDVDFSKTPERLIKFIFGTGSNDCDISTKGMLYLEWYMDNSETVEAVYENEKIESFCQKLIESTKE